MKPLIAIGAFAVVLAACAIATGPGSVATVGTRTDFKREVAASAPVIEEVLIQEKK